MLEKIDILKNIWYSHDNYLAKYEGKPDNFDISHFMANIFCPGPFYYYILNSPDNILTNISPSIEPILGLTTENVTLENLLELLHPDDLPFFLKCEDTVAHFLNKCIPPEKIPLYKINYCLREKTKHHGYRLFLLQTITLKTTPEGALLSVFGTHTDISHITQINNRTLSLIGLEGEPSYLNIDVFQESVFDGFKPFDMVLNEYPYTTRELEIIKCLAQGLTSDEIGQKLNISNRTVDTHRNNLLRKSDTKNTIELVAECIKKGYI